MRLRSINKYLAPEGSNVFSVENTDENEPQPAQWPAEAHRCPQDNVQNHIPLYQHWTKGFGWSTGFRLQTRSRAVVRSFESEHGEHVDQDIDS